MNLSAIDLNLLVVFRALMRERHVTRAGAAVGMSQSGMSNALARLRELTGDPLFVRGRDSMVPSPYALELSPRLHQALELIDVALSRERFDPAQSERTYVMAMPDAIEGLFIGQLMRRISAIAPRVRLGVVPLGTTRPRAEVLLSEVDLAVGAIVDEALEVETLYAESYSVLFDAGALRERLTLARYCRREHVVWSTRGDLRGHLDNVLRQHGRQRRVVASTCSFLLLPQLLKGSTRIATVPTRIARMLAESHELKMARVPFDLPGFEIRMAWHPIWDLDPGSVWLREQVRTLAGLIPD